MRDNATEIAVGLVFAVILGLLAALVWAQMVADVANSRRDHAERVQALQICRTAPDPATCIRGIGLP